MDNIADFRVDKEKCIGCGRCVKTCPGGILYLDESKKAHMKHIDTFGWNGCWKCEHCLAVCQQGAVSVFKKVPENSIQKPNPNTALPALESIMANRRTCRRFSAKQVDRKQIERMIDILANAPNGGNKQLTEFTLIDNAADTDIFRKLVYKEMEQLLERGVYPEGFDEESYKDMKRWEQTVRPDMLFCGAPYLLIPHAPIGQGELKLDTAIAASWFELLCAASGLGCAMMTFPLAVLNNMPHIKAMLQIPEDHFISMIIGFGYPEIQYVRSTQRTVSPERVHRLCFQNN